MSAYWLFAACDGQNATMTNEPEPAEEETGLVGVWTTRGVDETLGEVEVEMTLAADGSLGMVLVLASGARRSFPGAWFYDEDQLVLTGAYFTPDGESRVRWRVEQALLLLEDAAGRQQEWHRKE